MDITKTKKWQLCKVFNLWQGHAGLITSRPTICYISFLTLYDLKKYFFIYLDVTQEYWLGFFVIILHGRWAGSGIYVGVPKGHLYELLAGTSLIKQLAVFLLVGFIDWTARYSLRLSYQK